MTFEGPFGQFPHVRVKADVSQMRKKKLVCFTELELI